MWDLYRSEMEPVSPALAGRFLTTGPSPGKFPQYLFNSYNLVNHSDKAMAPHSSALAWKIPWTEEPGGLQSTGSLRVGHDWATSLSLFPFMHWRRKWQLTPVFLPGESQGREPGGLPFVGSHRVGHDWCDLAAAAAFLPVTLSTSVVQTANRLARDLILGHLVGAVLATSLWCQVPPHTP